LVITQKKGHNLTQIILARHGQTAWNKGEVFRGRTDIDLDETGLKQAELLAGYLENTNIEAIYCSPLKRAFKTAQAVARRHNLTARPVPGINDISFGEWEGKSFDYVRENYKETFGQWARTPHLVKLPGGETLNELTARAMAFVQETVQKHPGAVVVVSHQVVHKCLILAMLGLDNASFWKIVMDTAAITTFNYQQNIFVLKEHNNTS
jgi:broad specificity phosphatase PhoE